MSEVYFDENQNWKIEITNCYKHYDSIMIESSSGISRINSFLSEGYDFTVITTDSLATPLSIQKTGDFIKLYFYMGDYISYTDYVAIGNHENSYIHNLQQGYSIARYGDYEIYSEYFHKCITPSLGYPNNLEGSEGYISGNIYEDGQLLTDGTFKFDDTNIQITNTGYSGIPLSRTYTTLWYNNQHCEITPVSIEPNETSNYDIQFIFFSINRIKKQNITFSIFPNPANDIVKFYYKTEFHNDKEIWIEIRDFNGRLVDKIDLHNTEDGYITYNLENKNKGLYICSLMSDHKKLRETKLIIQ